MGLSPTVATRVLPGVVADSVEGCQGQVCTLTEVVVVTEVTGGRGAAAAAVLAGTVDQPPVLEVPVVLLEATLGTAVRSGVVVAAGQVWQITQTHQAVVAAVVQGYMVQVPTVLVALEVWQPNKEAQVAAQGLLEV